MERLKVISDISAFTNFSNTMNFIPSWHLKDRNSPTQDSRRYLGLLTFDQNFYTVYSVYGKKDDKIRICMINDLYKRHHVEYTDFRHMDFLVDNELYLKMMLFLDINQICYVSNSRMV